MGQITLQCEKTQFIVKIRVIAVKFCSVFDSATLYCQIPDNAIQCNRPHSFFQLHSFLAIIITKDERSIAAVQFKIKLFDFFLPLYTAY